MYLGIFAASGIPDVVRERVVATENMDSTAKVETDH